jgi:hypothetical protein
VREGGFDARRRPVEIDVQRGIQKPYLAFHSYSHQAFMACSSCKLHHSKPTLYVCSFPHRFIGGIYGRVIGRVLVDLHGGVPSDHFWRWIDPGALALIGAASFFGGVSRLTMSLTVIMVGAITLLGAYEQSVMVSVISD